MGHYFTNENIESNLQIKDIIIKDKKFKFYVDNGVFSKKGLDFGSRTLINTLLNEDLFGDILDVGCGYGALGIILSSFFHIKADLIDVNLRAIHLAKMNAKLNNTLDVQVRESNVYTNVKEKYDFIVTNPPIRAGKEIVYKILFEAKEHLKENGCLYFVMNKNQGAKSAMKDLSEIAQVSVLEKNKGFFVIKCIFDWQFDEIMVII